MSAVPPGDPAAAAAAAEVLAGLAADAGEIEVSAFEKGYLAGAAAALRMVADPGDSRGQG